MLPFFSMTIPYLWKILLEVLSFIRKEQKEKIMLTVKDLKDLKGKRVYVRVDFNVPQTNGVIRDTNRIKAALGWSGERL